MEKQRSDVFTETRISSNSRDRFQGRWTQGVHTRARLANSTLSHGPGTCASRGPAPMKGAGPAAGSWSPWVKFLLRISLWCRVPWEAVALGTDHPEAALASKVADIKLRPGWGTCLLRPLQRANSTPMSPVTLPPQFSADVKENYWA